MKVKKVFHTGLFGFRKKDVLAEFQQLLDTLDEKEAEIARLTATPPETPIPKEELGDVFWKAELAARGIIEEAERKADEMHHEACRRVEEEKAELKRLQEQISDIQTQMQSHLRSLEEQMGRAYEEINLS